MGENGAGKSTLCKAIAGTITLSAGQYLIKGQRSNFQKPADALAAGIAMVYQETSLVPTSATRWKSRSRSQAESPCCVMAGA